MENFILHPSDIPVTKEDVKSLMIVPDLEFPREIPPTNLWSSNRDKIQARQKILNYQQFFHEQVPAEVETNPKILQKEKYGDFPNVRFVFEPPYDYLKIPTDDIEKNTRRKRMGELRQKVRNVLKDDEKAQIFEGELMTIGEEEKYINDNIGDIPVATDSDEENMAMQAANNTDTTKIKENFEKSLKEEKMVKMLTEELASKSDLTYTRNFRYEGNDLENYLKELRNTPNFKVAHAKNKLNEDIIQVAFENKFHVNYDDAKMIFEKYHKELSSGLEEFEVDEEDAEKIQKLLDCEISPQDMLSEFVTQHTERVAKEKLDNDLNLEDIEKWGQFVNMRLQAEKEEIEENTFFQFQSY